MKTLSHLIVSGGGGRKRRLRTKSSLSIIHVWPLVSCKILLCYVGPWCVFVPWTSFEPVARRVGLVLEHFPFTSAASQWLYVNLVADPIPALGFLWPLRFPPIPKNRNPSISVDRTLIHSRSQSAVHSIPRMGNPIKRSHNIQLSLVEPSFALCALSKNGLCYEYSQVFKIQLFSFNLKQNFSPLYFKVSVMYSE